MSEHPPVSAPAKPSPIRDAASAPFFDGAAQGKLMIGSCSACGSSSLAGGTPCPKCLGRTEWVEASGRATVFSWGVVHQLTDPAFAHEIPYLIGTVKLAEGPRMLTRFTGLTPTDIRAGMGVQACFEQWPNGESLPVFGPL